MQNLLKFALLTLISLTTLNAGYFDGKSIQFFRDAMTRSFAPDGSQKFDGQFLDSSHVKIGNDIYSYSQNEIIAFNIGLKSETGFYLIKVGESFKELYHYDKSYEFIHMSCQGNLCQNNDFYEKYPQAYKKVTFSIYKKYVVTKIATCQPNEHFNTQTKQCQSCPEGYSWDKENNRCYKDCTDENKNKWGNTDGSCIDCSDKKTSDSVAECYCKFYGLLHLSNITVHEGNGFYSTSCSDGGRFRYKDPTTPDVPKPDNNNTTPNNPGGGNTTPGGPGGGNGGPGGGSGGPGGGNGNDGNNNGPGGGDPSGDSEFCKKNPNDPKCKGPGGDNEFCKKNPKDPKCKVPGGGGPSGNFDPDDNKDKDAKFDPKDFDFKDLEKDVNDFKSKYSDALDTISNSFTNTKQGIEQFIANVQGKGMNGITKKNVPTTCPHIYTIDFNGYPSDLNFDFCKVVAPASGAFYHLFYVIFFLGFLMLIVKLLIFSF